MDKVIAADRIAAWAYRPACYTADDCPAWLSGQYDTVAPVIQAFMRHRLSTLPAAASVEAGIIEMCAKVAERDVDWTTFAKGGVEPWDAGADNLRDYRLGINVGRAIAAAIRALTAKGKDQADG